MSEVIVITSGKGGVGKTTTTANVGTGLAKEGKKVVLIDTDIGLRNLDVVMGLENRIVYNLVDVIEGNCRIKQALIKDKRYPTLYLLPSAQTRDKTAVTPEQMEKLTNELKEEFDYILHLDLSKRRYSHHPGQHQANPQQESLQHHHSTSYLRALPYRHEGGLQRVQFFRFRLLPAIR